MGKLDGKVAVVTGGGRGVGRAICLAYAAEGADVVVNFAGNQATADEVVAMIKKMGRRAVAIQGRVENKEEAVKTVQAAVDNFGRIDVLVNNAGATKPAMLHKMTEEQWDSVVDIHLKGPFLCVQAAAKYFMEQNYGKIINVTSVAGLVGTTGQINYSAAKGGVLSFTMSCARELARYNVTANVISLGIVKTDMTEKITTDEKLKEIYMRRILMNRYGDPAEIAPAFVFFGCDDSAYITGQLLRVDGGYGMT